MNAIDRASAWHPSRWPRPFPWQVLILCGLLSTGCSPWSRPTPSSAGLLQRAVATNDRATLEIYFVSLPASEAEATEEAWGEIDEQPFPADLRERLARNGMRAGLISGNLPAVIEEALDLDETWLQRPDGWQQVDLDDDQAVHHRLLQVADGTEAYIAESEIRPRMPVLWRQGDQTRGRTFRRAQCMFSLSVARQGEGQLELKLLPEIHHGDARQKVSGDHGVFHFEFSRPKEIFSDLDIRARLTPGQMLVVGRRADRTGSIGHQFFSADGPRGPVEKLLIIRLVGPAAEALFPNSDATRVEHPPAGHDGAKIAADSTSAGNG
ncbi:MAG: hypothetical protein ACC645_11985 [Pirellulales bacterium]